LFDQKTAEDEDDDEDDYDAPSLGLAGIFGQAAARSQVAGAERRVEGKRPVGNVTTGDRPA
jgi:hypothetical protein